MQKLRPADIADWHSTLLKSGGRDGRPLSARTVGHAHRVLHSALARATKLETVSRNVAGILAPPKVESTEIECLTETQIGDLLTRLTDHPLHMIVMTALGTGMRRGELCGLQWKHVDLEKATIDVERSLEETNAGLRVKSTKSRLGRRQISLPASVVEALRQHRLRQGAVRLALGIGRPGPNDLVFGREDGTPLAPDRLSQQWGRTAAALGLPQITFHAFRHSHASALIAAGLDVVTISRRLGHSSPGITLNVYAHKLRNTDAGAAKAMDVALGKN